MLFRIALLGRTIWCVVCLLFVCFLLIQAAWSGTWLEAQRTCETPKFPTPKPLTPNPYTLNPKPYTPKPLNHWQDMDLDLEDPFASGAVNGDAKSAPGESAAPADNSAVAPMILLSFFVFPLSLSLSLSLSCHGLWFVGVWFGVGSVGALGLGFRV